MNIRRIFLSLLFLALCSGAMADGNPEVVNVLKSKIDGKFAVLSETTGDLNNDGLDDWVGIVVIGSPPNATQRVFVLTRNNGLVFAESSLEVAYKDCAGTCLPEIWPIKKGSFFVAQSDSGGWGSAGTTTQFKLYKGQWRAIGQRTYRLDAQNNLEYSTDANLLTGAFVSNHSSGTTRGKATKAKKRGTGKPLLLLLKDFDVGQF
jgi:hypothetical protein